MIVAKVTEIPEGRGMSYTVEGRRIAVFHAEGKFYALDDLCTHADAPLAGGWVDGKCVACPWHGAEFDLETGNALSLPATGRAATHKVTIIDGATTVRVSPMRRRHRNDLNVGSRLPYPSLTGIIVKGLVMILLQLFCRHRHL